MQLSLILADWAARGGLDDSTAPLVAALAWAQQEDYAVHPSVINGWNSVAILCEESGLQYAPLPPMDEARAEDERRQSRMDDTALANLCGQPARETQQIFV